MFGLFFFFITKYPNRYVSGMDHIFPCFLVACVHEIVKFLYV
jgi:hypothetical protein